MSGGRPEARPGSIPSGQTAIGLALALFVLCASLWSLSIPAFESPDEPGHARYVNHMRSRAQLPEPGREAAGEAHQPPMYYALVAGVSRLAGWDEIQVAPRRNDS